MPGLRWYQDPYDGSAPITITPEPGQIIRVVIPDTHKAGPAADRDGCVEVRPVEGK